MTTETYSDNGLFYSILRADGTGDIRHFFFHEHALAWARAEHAISLRMNPHRWPDQVANDPDTTTVAQDQEAR